MLSVECRKALRRMGYRQNVEVRSCSKCGKNNSELPKETKHPFYDKVIAARQELEKNRLNKVLQKQLHDFASRLHHTSKCCGYRYIFKEVDQQEALWNLWLNRHALVAQTATGAAKERQKLAAMAEHQRQILIGNGIQVPEFTEADMNAIRRAAGNAGRRRDNDFLIMSRLMCVGDIATGNIVKIFRAEEERQKVKNTNINAPLQAKVIDFSVERKSQIEKEDSILASLRA